MRFIDEDISMKFSLSQQIEEVQRELKLRAEVYPRMIATRKMKQSVADYHSGRMESVLETLLWLQKHSADLREAVERKRETDG